MNAELIAELQKTLKQFLGEIEGEAKLDRSHLDRLNILVEAFPKDEVNQRFRKMLEHLSQNRSKFDADDTAEALRSLDALLQTEIFVEGVREREGSDPSLHSFFSPGNEDRIKMLEKCGEIRGLIQESAAIDSHFRRRLLKRVAAMEIEINKEEGLFDVLLGGLSDAGEAIGQFGDDIKPITDRFREIVAAGRRSAREYDELPKPDEIKRLPAPDEEE